MLESTVWLGTCLTYFFLMPGEFEIVGNMNSAPDQSGHSFSGSSVVTPYTKMEGAMAVVFLFWVIFKSVLILTLIFFQKITKYATSMGDTSFYIQI